MHEISEDFCLITEQTLAGSAGSKVLPSSTWLKFYSPCTSVFFFIPVYNTQAEFNMGYLVGNVWIYRRGIR